MSGSTLIAGLSLGLMVPGIVLAAWGARTHRRSDPRRFCPGPRRSRWRWLWPLSWYACGACAYDLSHAPRDSCGRVRCPECGATSQRAQPLLRSTRRWRPGWLGLTFMLLATAAITIESLRQQSVMPLVPATALITIESVLGNEAPDDMRRELRSRASDGELAAWQLRSVASLLVRELADDDVKWNAQEAIGLLRVVGEPATAALEAVLESPDWQQRQLAAHALRQLPSHEPSELLLRVTVEGLRNDALPRDRARGRYSYISNAGSGVRYLFRHAWRSRALLQEGLQSNDPQQRLLCAGVAGLGGVTLLTDRAAPILIDHLRDNAVRNDATFATRALWGFGRDVVPLLEAHRQSPDAQQRQMIEFLLERFERDHLDHPLNGAKHRQSITRWTHDPTMIDPEWLELPRF